MKITGFSRVSKDLIVGELEKEIKTRPTFFIIQHGSISASSLDKLRTKLRTTKSRYFSVKNSLGRIALKRNNLSDLSGNLAGSCGFAFTNGDPVLSSKTLVDFAKENTSFKIAVGYLDGKTLSLDQIKTLASLPSREVLLAKALGGMKTPITKFVGVLAGTIRQIVTVLDAIAKKKA